MKAVYLERIGAPLRVVDRPAPVCPADGVVVSVLAVRVPAYTASVADGSLDYDLPIPLVIGPACIGRIEGVGSGVFNVAPGDIALCNSLLSSGDHAGSADEILIGWTGTGTERSNAMQRIWRDGSFAEQAAYPARCITALAGAERFDPALLTYIAPLAIAANGLERGGIAAGTRVIINGATGQLGGAAVLYALARGAERVVAVGRDSTRLGSLAALSPRITAHQSIGSRTEDAKALTALCEGGADLVADYLGKVPDAVPTLAAIDALRIGGTAVLVGGVAHDLPLPYATIMRRRLTIAGSFMFDTATALACWHLVRAGLIDLSHLTVSTFPLERIDDAIASARQAGDFDLPVLTPTD